MFCRGVNVSFLYNQTAHVKCALVLCKAVLFMIHCRYKV